MFATIELFESLRLKFQLIDLGIDQVRNFDDATIKIVHDAIFMGNIKLSIIKDIVRDCAKMSDEELKYTVENDLGVIDVAVFTRSQMEYAYILNMIFK